MLNVDDDSEVKTEMKYCEKEDAAKLDKIMDGFVRNASMYGIKGCPSKSYHIIYR